MAHDRRPVPGAVSAVRLFFCRESFGVLAFGACLWRRRGSVDLLKAVSCCGKGGSDRCARGFGSRLGGFSLSSGVHAAQFCVGGPVDDSWHNGGARFFSLVCCFRLCASIWEQRTLGGCGCVFAFGAGGASLYDDLGHPVLMHDGHPALFANGAAAVRHLCYGVALRCGLWMLFCCKGFGRVGAFYYIVKWVAAVRGWNGKEKDVAMECVKVFETYLNLEKKVSDNTCRSYVRDVNQFICYVLKQGGDPLEATTQTVKSYVAFLTEKGRSAATITRMFSSLKCFYQFLKREGLIDWNPAQGISHQKVERKLPEILTNEEVELFLEQPRCTDCKGYRDRAMLETLYATGIRVGELIALNMNDLNLSLSFIRCTGRKKSRTIPLYPTAVHALTDYAGYPPQYGCGGRGTSLVCQPEWREDERQGFGKSSSNISSRQTSKRSHAPYAAAFVCGTSAGKWRGSTLHSGDAGSCRYFFHADLCANCQPKTEVRL